MLGSNPAQLRLRHWLSDALTTRLDPHLARSRPQLGLGLIHTWLDLIHTWLDLIHNPDLILHIACRKLILNSALHQFPSCSICLPVRLSVLQERSFTGPLSKLTRGRKGGIRGERIRTGGMEEEGGFERIFLVYGLNIRNKTFRLHSATCSCIDAATYRC
jgi:hypothetical protein